MNQKKYSVGYTTGVYDMFHIGHLNLLKNAKALCDYLIVGVSTDELVMCEKGHLPIIAFYERMEIVSAIKYADRVVEQPDKNKYKAWEKYRFDAMFVGSDWKGTPQWEKYERELKPKGVDIVYLPHTDGISSTKLASIIKDIINTDRHSQLIDRDKGQLTHP